MKQLFLILGIVFGISTMIYATDENTPVKSEVKNVTVFLSSAQITRTATTTLLPGQNKIVFEGLSQYINANSIQVKGTGDFTILSVSSQLDYMNTQPKTKEVITLEDSMESYNTQVLYLQSMLENYVTEKNMIIANQSIGGADNGVKIEDLKAAAEFFRTRLSDIALKYLATNAKIKKIQEKINTVSNELAQLNAKKNIPTGEILVTVTAKTKCTANFALSYTASNAGWVPSYDLRASDATSPIALTYKASVYQTTGEDWRNVNLTLSTGNPTLSGTKPELYPWYLYIYNTSYDYRSSNKPSVAMDKNKDAEEKAESNSTVYENALTSADYTTVSEAQTNIEFTISLPYTILTDGKPNDVEIQNYSLPATYQYYCAPKLDNDAFLIARVSGWEQYNLLSGNMNLYFEGTYVGKSYLNSKSTEDTLDISLGRDKNISITRIKQKTLTSKNIIGSNRKETIAWEISIRNKKKQAINIVIEDQIPVTTDKIIEIEKSDTPDASYDETTGILTWKLKINSAETKKLNFSYTVKYPKENVIYLE
jgi:uncharacterized protein (TIGR02231 family)